jgi:hypothetical protein
MYMNQRSSNPRIRWAKIYMQVKLIVTYCQGCKRDVAYQDRDACITRRDRDVSKTRLENITEVHDKTETRPRRSKTRSRVLYISAYVCIL